MTESRASTYARAGAWSLVAHTTQLLGSVALSVIVVRLLPLDALGELSLGRQLAALLAVGGSLALERTLVRFVPELAERGLAGSARKLVLSLLRLRLLVGAVLALAVVLLREPVARGLGFAQPDTVVVAAVSSLGFSAAAHVRGAANSWFEARRVAQAAVLTATLTLGATVVAVGFGGGVLTILSIAALAALFGAAWTWPGALGRAESTSGELHTRRVWAYTAPFAAIVLLNQLVHSQTEVFFLGRLRGPAEVAWFQYGFVLAQRIVDFLPLALWEVSMAAFAREDTLRERDLSEVSHRYLQLIYLVLLPVTAMGVALSPTLVDILYGAKMAPAAWVAQAYFVLGCVAAFGAPMGMVLYAREATALVLRLYLVATTLNLLLDWWLVSRFGLTGAVVGLACAKLFLVIAMSSAAARQIGGLSVPWSTIARAATASSVVVGWVFLAPDSATLAGLVTGAVACTVSILLLYRMLHVVDPVAAAFLTDSGIPGGRLLTRIVVAGGGRKSP